MAILVVDDDPVQCRLLEAMLQKSGYEAIVRDNGDAALSLLSGADGPRIDCVILDLVMPNLDGLGVLARLRQAAINVPVIVQTAHGGIDNVVSAMRAGAVDFVVKPVGAERLQVSIRNALNTSALEGELNRIKHSRAGTLSFDDIITKSANMQAVLRMAEKAAASTIPVQIAGESGVGKELIARAIQEGEVEPVGARKAVKVDVRIVSATNRDLIADVKAGRFREDLFYRLHVFPITVPPLRERAADIPALARHFLARFAAEEGKRIRAISPEALHLLAACHWPGNIRQLENTLFRAVVLADGDTISLAEFPQISGQVAVPAVGESAAPNAAHPLAPDFDQPLALPEPFARHPGAAAAATAADALAVLDPEGDVRPLEDIEAELIRYAITHYRGQMSEVARRLKIGRSTLYRKLEALGLNTERDETDSDAVA